MESRTIDMEREPGKMTGILKYNNMESAAKALNGHNVVGKNSGYTVTHDTPKVTPDKKFHPHLDANNSPSWDDDDSDTNSTSNSSFLEMKAWTKKATKTCLVPEYKSTGTYQMLRKMPALVLDHPLLQQKPLIMVVVFPVMLVLLLCNQMHALVHSIMAFHTITIMEMMMMMMTIPTSHILSVSRKQREG